MKKMFFDHNGEMRILWVAIIAIVNFYVCIVGVNVLMTAIIPNKMLATILYALVSCTLCYFVTNAIAKRFSRRLNFSIDLFTFKRIGRMLLFGVLIGVITNFAWLFLSLMTNELVFSYNGFDFEIIIGTLLVYIPVGFVEECTFRGLIDNSFSKFGNIIGIVASALIFSSLHMEFTPLLFLERFVFGLLFSVLMRVSKSLILVIAAHIMHNFGNAAILGIGDTTGDTIFTTLFKHKDNFLVGDVEAGSIILILIILVLLGSTIYYAKRKQRTFL